VAKSQSAVKRIALVGNPNIGKTTLFNKLCGLNQKTGNYPGVTIDKKRGSLKGSHGAIEIIDLPGINSLTPGSKDEELVVDYLLNKGEDFPAAIVVIASALNLKKNLYVFDQLADLEIPIVLAVNMVDLAEKRGIFIDPQKLHDLLGVNVVMISAKKETGIQNLVDEIGREQKIPKRAQHFIEPADLPLLAEFSKKDPHKNDYTTFLELTSGRVNANSGDHIKAFIHKHQVKPQKWKTNESILRYKFLSAIVASAVKEDKSKATDLTSRLDRVLLHRFWGYVIFLFILFSIFQSVFWLASYPMDWIDQGFAALSGWMEGLMPPGYFTRLLTEGIIPGIGGVIIFIPQIAVLFFLFSILEESGYMPRIVFLMDRLMQRFGMSGKSVVPMISGFACAIPAIMSARTIEHKKERLITILITPLLTCSARIPVYVVMIAIIVPDTMIGIFNARGLALMALYIIGVVMAFIAAYVFKKLLRGDYKSYLIMEMPEYLLPAAGNILISVWTNVKAFVWNAGKIIVATSIILFVLATNGSHDFKNAERETAENYSYLPAEEQGSLIESRKLETSFLGMIGHGIEPVIRPLGYDWKIGIAILSSLAAREVFVGTISTIYSIGSEDEMTITERLRTEKNGVTGLPAFSFATCVSLLLFYAFSLQCLSTVAVTYKETQSIKWTLIQFFYMTILAYLAALIAYQVLK
jgi:ferrous iron transport protein B